MYSQHTEKMNSKWAAEHMLYACSLCAVMSKVSGLNFWRTFLFSACILYTHIECF